MLNRISRISALLGGGKKTANFLSAARQMQLQHDQAHLQSPSVALSACKKYLVLDEPQNQLVNSKFPLLWLRDNCQCNECCHSQVNRRILDWSTFERPQGLHLSAFKFNERENCVELQWTDGHESAFKVDFFKTHRFDRENVERYLKEEYRLPKIPWTKKSPEFEMPRFNLEEIMFNQDGREMKRWLKGLCQTGMAVLENRKLLDRPELMSEFIAKVFGFCKETHYGREFLIQNRINDITNIAYLNGNLQLHTDLPYYSYIPGVTILHYLKQSQFGGLSTLVDGFQIAERMRKETPEAFEVLSKVPVNFVDKGVENSLKFHKVHLTPVIKLRKDGELDRISFSVPQRDTMFSVGDPELVHKWYEAMQIFLKFSREEVLEFKMETDFLLTFDNTRLLHGRTAYEAHEHRTIVGCYVDWDEVYSKYRATEEKE